MASLSENITPGTPSLSVVMSVYESEKPEFFDRSMKSIWTDQTHRPDEIILVQDGPLPAALNAVMDHWKEVIGERLVLLVNETNIGLTKSLNKGIALAKGDYIARMDSDDISLPTRFERQIDYMEAHPEADVLGTGMQEIDENGVWGAERSYPLTPERIRIYIAKASPLAHPTVMFRRRVFDEGHFYDETFRKSQDIKMWYDLIRAGYRLYNLNETLLHFRRHSDTYIKRSSKQVLNSELNIYLHGIRDLHGPITWRYIYPLCRYLVKLSPTGIYPFFYKHLFRKKNS